MLKKTIFTALLFSLFFVTGNSQSVTYKGNILYDNPVPRQNEYKTYLSRIDTPTKSSPRGAIKRVEDIAGSYLMYFVTPVSNTVVHYTEVTVAKLDDTHVTIDGFWSTAASTLTAEVDLSKGTVTIPSQKVYKSSTYGDCDLAPYRVDSENNNAIIPIRTGSIPGNVVDGGIEFNTYAWGIFINEGDNKDKFLMIGYTTNFHFVNGEDETIRLSDSKSTKNAVVITQQDEGVTIKNFAGFGGEVTVKTNADNTVSLDRQTVYSYYDNTAKSTVDYQSYAMTDDGKVNPNINIGGYITKSQLTLNRWAMLIQGETAGSYSGVAYKSYNVGYTDGTTFSVTSVNTPYTNTNVLTRKYYNPQGLQSEKPFKGINIIVETLSDGSIRTRKQNIL